MPNIFTAWADILVGLAVVGFSIAGLLLLVATSCFYSAGMILNDVFDIEIDRVERPFRPLPTGAISLTSAMRCGAALLLFGLIATWAAGWLMRSWQPPVVGGMLVTAILIYDAGLKETVVGPLAMALCRILNLALGLTLVPLDIVPTPARIVILASMGVFILGVTLFARSEASVSSRLALNWSAALVALGVILMLVVPVALEAVRSSLLLPYYVVCLLLLGSLPVRAAIADPGPNTVQRAVKWMVLGVIGLDAGLASAMVGSSGFFLLLLFVPAILLGRRVYST